MNRKECVSSLVIIIIGICGSAIGKDVSLQIELDEIPHVEKNDHAWVQSKETLYLDRHLFTGILVDRYLNGALYRESHYQSGIKEGVEKEYALNGNLIAVWTFIHGKKEGVQQGWYAEGPKKFEFRYQGGFFEGEQIEWHMNGKVFRRQVYHQGTEVEKKVLFPGSEIFSNYIKSNGRTYGLDGGALCFEAKKRR